MTPENVSTDPPRVLHLEDGEERRLRQDPEVRLEVALRRLVAHLRPVRVRLGILTLKRKLPQVCFTFIYYTWLIY